jgi:hypothetical protein
MNLGISEDVVFRDLAGEAVILNLASGTYFGLDPVGTRIWHLIGELGSPGKIVEALLSEYEVDEKQVRRDVDDLIEKLIAKGLVKAEAGGILPPG